MEKVSVVIPVRNNFELTMQTIQSIRDNFFLDYEIIVVDDSSSDDTQKYFTDKMIKQETDVLYFRFNENIWVTKAWNFWIDVATNDYIMVINNDILFKPGVDVAMVKSLQAEEDIYVTWPLYTTGVKPRRWDIRFTKENICWHCWMTTKDKRFEIGPIDERLFLYYNDDRIFRKVLKDMKKKINVSWKAFVHHLEHKTINLDSKIGLKILRDDIQRQIISTENGR